MNCPKCESSQTYVVDSRPLEEKYKPSVRRRRKCMDCGYAFTTYEVVSEILESGEKAKKVLNRIRKLVQLMKGDEDE